MRRRAPASIVAAVSGAIDSIVRRTSASFQSGSAAAIAPASSTIWLELLFVASIERSYQLRAGVWRMESAPVAASMSSQPFGSRDSVIERRSGEPMKTQLMSL